MNEKGFITHKVELSYKRDEGMSDYGNGENCHDFG